MAGLHCWHPTWSCSAPLGTKINYKICASVRIDINTCTLYNSQVRNENQIGTPPPTPPPECDSTQVTLPPESQPSSPTLTPPRIPSRFMTTAAVDDVAAASKKRKVAFTDCCGVSSSANQGSDASDVDESEFSIEETMRGFTDDSVSSDVDYLRCVRRCLLDNMDIPPGRKPCQTHYSRWLLRRDKLNQEARHTYVRNNVATNNEEDMRRAIQQENDNNTQRYTRPNVMFDAWCCVGGATRPSFPAAQLMERYPSLKEKIASLREVMNVRLLSI